MHGKQEALWPKQSKQLIPFSGKEEDWNHWSKTFLATATAKGYREVIKPTDATTKADEELNIMVYNCEKLGLIKIVSLLSR